jgi:hypothetical protein
MPSVERDSNLSRRMGIAFHLFVRRLLAQNGNWADLCYKWDRVLLAIPMPRTRPVESHVSKTNGPLGEPGVFAKRQS